MNRITNAVKDIATRLDENPEGAAEIREKGADTLEASDWAAMGDLFTRGHLAGLLSLDEASALHDIHTRFFSNTTQAERMVMIMVSAEIMKGLR